MRATSAIFNTRRVQRNLGVNANGEEPVGPRCIKSSQQHTGCWPGKFYIFSLGERGRLTPGLITEEAVACQHANGSCENGQNDAAAENRLPAGDQLEEHCRDHTGAAFFVADLFLKPLVARMQGRTVVRRSVSAVLTETVSANHGRAQYAGVYLTERDGTLYAQPIRSKSGLISSLAGSDGYFAIPRDYEGLPQGSTVEVTVYHME